MVEIGVPVHHGVEVEQLRRYLHADSKRYLTVVEFAEVQRLAQLVYADSSQCFLSAAEVERLNQMAEIVDVETLLLNADTAD